MKVRDYIVTSVIAAAIVLGTLYGQSATAIDAQLPVGARLAAAVPARMCLGGNDFQHHDSSTTAEVLNSVGYGALSVWEKEGSAFWTWVGLVPPNWDGSSNFSCQITFQPVSVVPSGDVDFNIWYYQVVEGELTYSLKATVSITETWDVATAAAEAEKSDSAITLSAANLTAGELMFVTLVNPDTGTYNQDVGLYGFCCDYN